MTERTLFLSGTIAEESWFDDDVTPQLFRDELNAGSGDITVWINSPGGDCVAAAQIYNMLMDYKGNVTVKIDGIAASAASVIAMAGTKVLMSPVSMMMIHNPATIAFGDHNEMQKAIEMLESVKDTRTALSTPMRSRRPLAAPSSLASWRQRRGWMRPRPSSWALPMTFCRERMPRTMKHRSRLWRPSCSPVRR